MKIVLRIVLHNAGVQELRRLKRADRHLAAHQYQLGLLKVRGFFVVAGGQAGGLYLVDLPPAFAAAQTQGVLVLLRVKLRVK